MRLRQALAGLKDDIHGFALAERTPLFDERVEPDPVELFHHEIGLARIELTHVVDARDVLALQGSSRPRLVEKTQDRFRVLLLFERMSLTATGVPSPTWVAAQTTPMPPSPMMDPIR